MSLSGSGEPASQPTNLSEPGSLHHLGRLSKIAFGGVRGGSLGLQQCSTQRGVSPSELTLRDCQGVLCYLGGHLPGFLSQSGTAGPLFCIRVIKIPSYAEKGDGKVAIWTYREAVPRVGGRRGPSPGLSEANMSADGFLVGPPTSRSAFVAHGGAGAAAVHVGGLGGEATRAAPHVVHVLVPFGVHHALGSLKGSRSPW